MSTATMLMHLVVAMSVVIGVMWVAGRVLRSKGAGGTAPNRGRGTRGANRPQPIDVLARRGLSKGASVAVVRAGGRTLVLGVTDASVTLLGEATTESLGIDDSEAGAGAATGAPATSGSDLGGPAPLGANRSVVAALKELTVRRI